VCGWQVKLCDPLVTHRSYLSALEVQHDKALYRFTLLYFTLLCHSEQMRDFSALCTDRMRNFTDQLISVLLAVDADYLGHFSLVCRAPVEATL